MDALVQIVLGVGLVAYSWFSARRIMQRLRPVSPIRNGVHRNDADDTAPFRIQRSSGVRQ